MGYTTYRAAKLNEPFKANDVIGCAYSSRDRNIFFTKNGARLGEYSMPDGQRDDYYPAFGITSTGKEDAKSSAKLFVNFGATDFVYKIPKNQSRPRPDVMLSQKQEGNNWQITRSQGNMTLVWTPLGLDKPSTSSCVASVPIVSNGKVCRILLWQS